MSAQFKSWHHGSYISKWIPNLVLGGGEIWTVFEGESLSKTESFIYNDSLAFIPGIQLCCISPSIRSLEKALEIHMFPYLGTSLAVSSVFWYEWGQTDISKRDWSEEFQSAKRKSLKGTWSEALDLKKEKKRALTYTEYKYNPEICCKESSGKHRVEWKWSLKHEKLKAQHVFTHHRCPALTQPISPGQDVSTGHSRDKSRAGRMWPR